MEPETTRGKLFFDLRLPPGLAKTAIEDCKRKFEDELERVDPFSAGTCSRNKWFDLDVPTDTDRMQEFINEKLAAEGPENLRVSAPDPDPQPVTYCYPLDSQICYHPYSLEYNGSPWESYLAGAPDGVKVVIVLTYETPFFFTTAELRRVSDELEMVKEQKARAIKRVVDLEIAEEKASRFAPRIQETGS